MRTHHIMMLRSKVISRIVSRFALPQSSPTFGFRGGPVSSADSVGAERVPKGTQHPAPSSCRGGSQALSPTGRQACRGLRAFDPDIICKLAVGLGLLTLISYYIIHAAYLRSARILEASSALQRARTFVPSARYSSDRSAPQRRISCRTAPFV